MSTVLTSHISVHTLFFTIHVCSKGWDAGAVNNLLSTSSNSETKKIQKNKKSYAWKRTEEVEEKTLLIMKS